MIRLKKLAKQGKDLPKSDEEDGEEKDTYQQEIDQIVIKELNVLCNDPDLIEDLKKLQRSTQDVEVQTGEVQFMNDLDNDLSYDGSD